MPICPIFANNIQKSEFDIRFTNKGVGRNNLRFKILFFNLMENLFRQWKKIYI